MADERGKSRATRAETIAAEEHRRKRLRVLAFKTKKAEGVNLGLCR